MPVTIDETGATIEAKAAGAKPRVTLRQELVSEVAFWNLTQGFNPNPDALQSAFTIQGSVPVTGRQAELAQVQFGFIQFMRIKDYRIGWSGRNVSEGSILLDIARPVGRQPLLDCVPSAPRPFFSTPNGRLQAGQMVATMGDHSFTKVADKVHNDQTGFDNFLQFISDQRVATSVFVARGPDGRIRPIAHVQFLVNYEMELRWRGDSAPEPSVAVDRSDFQIGIFGIGPPPEGLVPRALLTGVNANTSPIANTASQQAMKNVANFQVLKQRFLTTPEAFFG